MKKRTLLLLLFSCILISAQKYPFTYYSIKEGLPSSSAYIIMQDSRGFLWIGTDGGGAAKFDGKHFNFINKVNGLPDNVVHSIFEDSRGLMWFGTDKGLAIFDGNIIRTLSDSLNFKGSVVLGFIEDKHNNIWAYTNNGGINKIILKNNNPIKIINIGKNSGLIGNFVMNAKFDSYDKLWLAMYGGINVVTLKNDTFEVALLEKNYEIPSDFILSLSQVNNNEWWASTYDNGIFKINNIIQPKKNNCKADQDVIKYSNRIWKILSENNELWLGSDTSGVIIKRDKNIQLLNSQNGFQNNPVLDIISDNEQNHWFATMGSGIVRLSGFCFSLFGKESNLPFNHFYSLEKNNNKILIGGESGIIEADLNTKDYRFLIKGITVKSIKKTINGTWIGSQNNGLFHLDNNNVKSKFDINNGMPSNQINCIESDFYGNIWVGTPAGLCQLNNDKNFILNNEQGLINNEVQVLLSDKNKGLWIGTLGGLAYIKGDEYRDFNEEDGLLDKKIYSLVEDKIGNIWIGTFGGGIYQYNASSKDSIKIKQLATDNQLLSNNIYSMLFANDTTLIVGTDKGMNKIFTRNGKIVKCFSYNQDNGFMSIENSLNAICNIGNEIYFGTSEGIMKYDISKENKQISKPKVYVSSISLFNESVNWDTLGFYNKNWFGLPINPNFKYNQNKLTFHFTGIFLSNPNNIKYSYILEGLDSEWTPYSVDQKAIYTSIKNGSYIFKLKAITSDGSESEVYTYPFVIETPFWKTYWFYLLILLTIVALVFFIVKYQTARLRNQNAHLEKVVKERTVEVEKQRDVVAFQKKELTDSIEYALRIQQAVMPNISGLNIHFENFIFFKPKDIVSGDFYWFGQYNDLIVCSVADCTGHGVPGAFMSMLGIRFLNEIVIEKSITQPDLILNSLREKIILALNQRGVDNENKDGMDIALCCINKVEKTISFAGANNPLIIVNSTGLTELKGDKMPIAHYLKTDLFALKYYNYTEGDMLYMYSDGYADQFGGIDGKKFKSSALKNLLSDIHKLPVNDQKIRIESNFETWRGNIDQIDDVALMGIRL